MTTSPESLYRSAPIETCQRETATIAFRRFGPPDAAERVLLVHGWPLSGFTWRKVLPALTERYACVTVDLAGAGDSEWTEANDFSFHGHAEHVQAVARQLGWDRYRLVAHDTGATVARRLAVIEGERVTHGVYLDTEIPNHRPPLVPLFQRLAAVPGAGATFARLLRSRRFVHSKWGFGGCFEDRSLLDGPFEEAFIRPLVTSRRAMDGQMRYVRGIDWKQLDALATDHQKITGPSLLLWGERDPFFPKERAREMVSQFRDCRDLIVIPNTRLFPHEERPDLVAQHLLTFFAA